MSENNKKKIFLVPPAVFPIPAVRGGAVETLINLLLDINEKENRVFFHVISTRNPKAEKLALEYKNSKIHFVNTKITFFEKCTRFVRRRLRRYIPFFDDMIVNAYYRKAFKICKKEKCDFVVAENGNYPEFKRFARLVGKENVLIHIHHHLLFYPEIKGVFGGTISVSHFIKNEWEKSCIKADSEKKQKNFVVVNAVDEDRFLKSISDEARQNLRSGFKINPDDILLLYLGRVIDVKGVLELAQATLDIPNPKVKLLIVGSADFENDTQTQYVQQIKKLVSENPEKLKHIGYIDNAEVYKINQCADLRVLPSQWEEAVSLAFIEAMLSGSATVITNSGGMPEVSCPEGAVIVEKGDRLRQNLVEAIEKIINEPGKIERMKTANKIHSERFRKANFYNDFVNVFLCYGGEK